MCDGQLGSLSFCFATCPAQPSAGLGQGHISTALTYIFFPPLAPQRNQFYSPNNGEGLEEILICGRAGEGSIYDTELLFCK